MPEIYALDLDLDLANHLAIPESVREIRAERISTELIYDDYVREIFEWQLDHVREHGEPATPSVLEDEFDELTLEDPETAIGDLIERLRDRWMRRGGKKALEKIGKQYSEDPLQVPTLLLEVGRDLQAMVRRKGEIYESGDFEKAIERYDERILRGAGPSLGFDLVDEHFHEQRGITIFAAPPKNYKSWITVQSAIENVMRGVPTTLYPLELSAMDTWWRATCLASDVPEWKYLRGTLTQFDREQLAKADEFLKECGHLRIEKPPPGERDIVSLVERARDDGAMAIYIDQLQYVETTQGKQLGTGDHKDYWGVLDAARELPDDVPLWIVHQFNRTAQFSEKMPEMQQLKGAAAVEETATLALGLWANKDMRKSNIVELGTLASRHHNFAQWEISVNLSRGCSFDMIGPAIHDDE